MASTDQSPDRRSVTQEIQSLTDNSLSEAIEKYKTSANSLKAAVKPPLVLILDDDHAQLRLYERLLKDSVELITTDSLMTAKAKLESGEVDLFFSDSIGLPLIPIAQRHQVPVIVVSGHNPRHVSGVLRWLEKPIFPDELREIIDDYQALPLEDDPK